MLCLLCSTISFAQDQKLPDDPKTDTWEKEKERLKYKRDKDFKGPEDWDSGEPTDIRDDRYVSPDELQRRMYGSNGSGSGSSSGPYYGGGGGGRGTLRYKPQQVQRQRQKNYRGFNRGGGGGTLKYDPKVKRPEPAKRPEPRVRPKRSNRSSSSSSSSSGGSSSGGSSSGFFNLLLIILVVVLVVILLYFFLRNRNPKDTRITVDVEDEWNPEIITKTELELKLEAAMGREDYRECVRIYFTFILKELIKKGWIRWKKEKTNHHYVMEMGGRDGSLGFMECVRIYDLVWYGEYQIDREIFEMLQPTLLNYYKSLDPTDE